MRLNKAKGFLFDLPGGFWSCLNNFEFYRKPFYALRETPLGQRATRMKCFTRLHVGQLLRLLLHDNLKKKNEITKLHRSVGKKNKSGLQADITAISRSIIHNEQIY